MYALLCKELGAAENLTLEEIADPEPQAGELLIEIHAAALNFPDTLVISGTYQLKPELPFVPGGEAAGIVRKVGADVEGFAVGDRVAFWGATGAFADLAAKPAREVVKLPADLDLVTGAAFLVAYGTSYYALKQCAGLRQDETLLVLGAAGGVGLAAVDLGAAMGARVIAAASSADKLEVAARAGATDTVNYATESLKDRVKALTAGRGVDVVYDPVGGDLAESALRATGWDGRYLVVGFASGDIPRIPLSLPLLKNCSIGGVFYGAWAQREPVQSGENLDELFAFLAAGEVNPVISRTFRLDEYVEAFGTLTGRNAVGKIVFRIRSDTEA